MDTPISDTLISLIPMMLIQGIYAIFAAQVAKRTQRSVPLFVILTLIPLFGMLLFVYVIWSTTLYVLDSINELKAKS
jgi:hypothetical protein